MQLSITMPSSTKGQKALFVLRAAYAAKPGSEKRAIKKALKKFKKARKSV